MYSHNYLTVATQRLKADSWTLTAQFRFKDVDALLPPKERDQGYALSASVFDLMLISWAGGECIIDDLGVLRADEGLTCLLHRQPMAPSTAHDFLRRIQYVGLDADAGVLGGTGSGGA